MSEHKLKAFNTSIFDRVLEGDNVAEKIRLAEQLSELACDRNAAELERQAIVPTLLALCSDPVKKVRTVLAQKLANSDSLHPDVVFSIIADDEDIALPFLAETKSLDRLRALTILKVGDKPRQMVLVAKAGLSPQVITQVVDECDSDICAALLDNEDVHLSNENYRRLYVRFRDVGEITERMLERSDLPLEVRILQAKRASESMHKMMAQRGWLPFDQAENIIADSQEKTMLRILIGATPGELTSLVSFLSKKNLLTPSIILRAACRGHLDVVAHVLAYLSSTPLDKINRIFEERAMMKLKSVYNKSHLPKNCFHIVRASVDVAGDLKQLPNRAAQMQFGSQIIECLMTRYNSITAAEKTKLLEVISQLSDENTRVLAKRVAGQLQKAA